MSGSPGFGSPSPAARRAIEVVKGRGAIGVMGFTATRRPTVRNERRMSIVGMVERGKVGGDDVLSGELHSMAWRELGKRQSYSFIGAKLHACWFPPLVHSVYLTQQN